MTDKERPKISVYSDGSSGGRSDEPGGYGWVVLREGHPVLAGYGGDPSTTNNLMELEGAIEGLRAVLNAGLHLSGIRVELVSDSQYVLGMAAGKFHPSKNIEKVAEIKELSRQLGVSFRWVRGHSKEPWNERVDSLAKKGKLEIRQKLERARDEQEEN